MSGSNGHNSFSRAHICQCLSRLYTLRRRCCVTVTPGGRKTGEHFVEGVLSLAAGLRHLGLRPGHVVAISAFNSDSYLEWILAVSCTGGIVAPLNYRWSFEETMSALQTVEPVMLVVDESFPWYSEYQRSTTLSSIRWLVLMGSFPAVPVGKENALTLEMLKRPCLKALPFAYLWAPEDVALLCFTSGTTGKPKGVAITHISLIIQSLVKIAVVGYSEDDVYLHTAPLCHIGGISSAMAVLMAGGCHVFIPKFESKLAVEAIEQHSVTSFITVPTMMSDLVSVIRSKAEWAVGGSIKKILNGGGSLSIDLLKDAIRIFPRATLLSAYGMTETCSSMTFQILNDPTTSHFTQQQSREAKSIITSNPPKGICVGRPAPHVEIMINSSSSDGEDACPSSSVGRILTRGPHVMLRYWDGSLTAGNLSSHGVEDWFVTGDIGRIDDNGNLWLMGRIKDQIKSGGENVYPEEVESVLSQHPGISSVVVVGVPHPRLSEMIVACVRLQEDWKWKESVISDSVQSKELLVLSSEILRQYCKQKNLSGFKVPKIFMGLGKPFPLTSTGKIRREQVRQEAMLWLQSSLPSRI